MDVVAEHSEIARRVLNDAWGDSVQAAVVAMLTLDHGQAVVTAIGAGVVGAVVGAASKELPGLLLRDRVRRSTDMVDMAVTYAKMDQDSFLEALLKDEQRRHLLHRAVQAASDATSEEKRRSLAAALAAGTIADDDAVVDDAVIVIDAVAQLEAVHLRVLERLTKTPHAQDYGQLADVPNFVPPWIPGQLEREIPQLKSVMVNLVAKLEALGMVERYDGGVAKNCLRLTAFGNMCLGSLLLSSI